MGGFAYLFPLPYWLFVDPADPPSIVEVKVDAFVFRLYPPFRDKSAQFLTLPNSVNPIRIPFRPYRAPSRPVEVLPAPISLPQFGGDSAGNMRVKFWRGGRAGSADLPPEENLPKDFIRVDGYGPAADMTADRAVEFFRSVMGLLRWRSGQWWITRSSQGLSSATYLSFAVSAAGSAVATRTRYSGVVKVHTLRGDEREVTEVMWRQAIQDAADGVLVPFYELLLLDARYFHSIVDLRQAVLQADAACEHLKEVVFEKLWTKRNPGKIYDSERRSQLLRNWDLPRHLDTKFQNHFRRTYKGEHPVEWQVIHNLWEARNNVAHGGPNAFGQPLIEVESKHVTEFLGAAKHCITWLLSLE
jgi:hypothetical protein